MSGSSCSSFLLHAFHRSYTLREQAGSSLHLQGSSRESLRPSSISSSCYTVNRVGREEGEQWERRGGGHCYREEGGGGQEARGQEEEV